MFARKIGIIGVTGSIGTQAQDVISLNRECFDPVFITAHTNKDALEEAGKRLSARHSLITCGNMSALIRLIDETEPDIVLVGASGLDIAPVVYHLAGKGITLAIANKECIVSSGMLLMEKAAKSGTTIVPVDSEHSAIFQCLRGHNKNDVEKLILTASGGALRDYEASRLKNVTVAEVLKHPNWEMGKKITVDSATMMNKGLELAEARVLFDVAPERLDVLIHPQSIIHSLVSYSDGSMLAQLGEADMRTPISYALGYPERLTSGAKLLELAGRELTFYSPDLEKYRCLKLAIDVLKSGRQSLLAVMNAANEEAVNAFLAERIGFTEIAETVEAALSANDFSEPDSMEAVFELDKTARQLAQKRINRS